MLLNHSFCLSCLECVLLDGDFSDRRVKDAVRASFSVKLTHHTSVRRFVSYLKCLSGGGSICLDKASED